MKRFAILAAASALALGVAAPASAAIYVSVTIDGAQQNALTGLPIDLGTGLAAPVYTANGVTVSLDITGKGSSGAAAPDPQFVTQALNIESGSGTHTVEIKLSQTGLTSTASAFAATNGINALLAGAGTTGSASIFVNSSNAAYAESTLIGSALSCTAGNNCSSPVMVSAATHPTPFSETVDYTFSLTGGRIQANSQLGAVPEAATWGMMILGFGMMGVALRSRKAKIAFA